MTFAATSEARRHRTSRLIAPFALVLVAVFAACAFFGYVLARESDARHQDQRRAALNGVIDEYRNVFADMTSDIETYMAHDLAADGSVPLAELTRQLAPAGLARYRHERACVIGRNGAVLGAYPNKEAPPPAIKRVIERLRAGLAGHVGDAAAAAMTPDLALPPVATETVLLDGEVTLVAVAAVRAAGAAGPLDQRTPVLVRAKRLDAGLIGAFEKMSGVSELAFDAESPRADRDVQSLIDAQGRIVGWLSWKREHPSMDAALRLLPLLGTVAACLLGFAAMALRQIGRATRRLAASEAEAHKIAYEDPVTGLPNRRMMDDLLIAALARRGNGRVTIQILKQ